MIMSLTTIKGVIEDGRVRLPAGVVLPEHQTVLVVVPDANKPATHNLPGARLANPEDAAKFEMQVSWGESP
jgi:hypothetical protein